MTDQADSVPEARPERSPERRDVQTVHPSIAKAVCRVMTAVTSVRKTQRNQHGGYNFASTDDIYAAVTHKMGEVGLLLITLEDSCTIKRFEGKDNKMVQWAEVTFSFVLATEEGTWSDPHARRTLYIQITGAQTFQAAQSYAEKTFLRSLFKLPTGDMDLDGMPQADDEATQIALTGNGTKRKSSSAAKKDGTDKVFNGIRSDIATATCAEHLQHLREIHADAWAEAPARWVEILDMEYEDKMAAFRLPREAAE